MKTLFRHSPCQIDDEDAIELRKPSIHEELLQAKYALENAYAGFDNVTDPDLIDCYIYEVNAVMKRYKYLLEQAAKSDLLPSETYDETYQSLTLAN
ncbi:MAG: YaaL family protein [Roseburia sp.]|nr:YaaL family protein [Ruminococcus sp.]MCM1155654.1 YaaL family protein [Roseburia sp.]MCM1241649.1 YaaL family protein [Roseburia sp.]